MCGAKTFPPPFTQSENALNYAELKELDLKGGRKEGGTQEVLSL